MFDDFAVVRRQPEATFGRDDFRLMVPLSAGRPHFMRPPRRIGGEPRTADVFNHLRGPQDIAQFDPAAFTPGPEVHFTLLVKKPGQLEHAIPNQHMPPVAYQVLQTAMDYHALTQGEARMREGWGKLEFMRCWVEPYAPAHPGNIAFAPVINHTDEGHHRYAEEKGWSSSNYACGTHISTRHVRAPFKGEVTKDNLFRQFDHMGRQRDYETRPAARLLGWSGAHPHAAGENGGDDPVLRSFIWLSYTDGYREETELRTLARKNPALT